MPDYPPILPKIFSSLSKGINTPMSNGRLVLTFSLTFGPFFRKIKNRNKKQKRTLSLEKFVFTNHVIST